MNDTEYELRNNRVRGSWADIHPGVSILIHLAAILAFIPGAGMLCMGAHEYPVWIPILLLVVAVGTMVALYRAGYRSASD